eukprot:gnl/Dysnectes_brevis/3930_a5117_748.p1 GENE.gnl/Dysnectes_brevis/3930_a5117_748~~gnl/Dysnectes_brevis/3930_a5117_748.p1  ORF type:complete len:277 (+),score=-15.77 gnl/Dysnectes_brevis/3930_a5117_748:90-920(+)
MELIDGEVSPTHDYSLKNISSITTAELLYLFVQFDHKNHQTRLKSKHIDTFLLYAASLFDLYCLGFLELTHTTSWQHATLQQTITSEPIVPILQSVLDQFSSTKTKFGKDRLRPFESILDIASYFSSKAHPVLSLQKNIVTSLHQQGLVATTRQGIFRDTVLLTPLGMNLLHKLSPQVINCVRGKTSPPEQFVAHQCHYIASVLTWMIPKLFKSAGLGYSVTDRSQERSCMLLSQFSDLIQLEHIIQPEGIKARLVATSLLLSRSVFDAFVTLRSY